MSLHASKQEVSMQTLETDILIVGSGLAGLRAATDAAKQGVRILVVSKGSRFQQCFGGWRF